MNYLTFNKYAIKWVAMLITVLMIATSCKKHKHEPDAPNGPVNPESPIAILSLNKTSGPYKTIVEISGHGFNADITHDKVWFNGKPASIVTATATRLTVSVPLLAGTGKVSLSIDEGTEISGPVFTYQYTMMVTTLAGNYRWDNTALFNRPMGLVADASGNLFVADFGLNMILKVDSIGKTTTFAGTVTSGFHDGAAQDATFNAPLAIAFNPAGVLYASEAGNGSIRQIDSFGNVTTISGKFGAPQSLPTPAYMAFDKDKNMYISEYLGSAIRKVTPAGQVSYFAGSGSQGSKDGTGTAASFAYPHGLAFDKAGNLFVADWYNNTIRKVTPQGQVTTFAGSGAIGAANGKGKSASFSNPDGLAIDNNGNLYVADAVSNLIRKIDSSGQVTTYAGTGAVGADDGAADKSSFSYPTGIAVDSKGIVYVVDQGNNLIRKIGLQ